MNTFFMAKFLTVLSRRLSLQTFDNLFNFFFFKGAFSAKELEKKFVYLKDQYSKIKSK